MSDKTFIYVLLHLRNWGYEGDSLEFCGLGETLEQCKKIAEDTCQQKVDWKAVNEDYVRGEYSHEFVEWQIYKHELNTFVIPTWLVEAPKRTEVDDFMDYVDDTYRINND